MELDFHVPFPVFAGGLPRGGAGTAGDNVLYSTRPFVDLTSGRPRDIGPVQSGERAMNYIHGSYLANAASTIKLQVWDVNNGAWVTINNGGTGDGIGAGLPATINYEIPSGDFQLVVNFAAAPTSWSTPRKLRLSRNP